MSRVYRFLSRSEHPAARSVRAARRALMSFTLPAPKVVVKPMLWTFLAIRGVYYYAMRVLVCEPLFKAYCTKYGRGVRTGSHIHWVMGKGVIILGDNVEVDGKCSFGFAARFSDAPTLIVGDDTGIGHGCGFTVGKRIEIGRNCRLAPGVSIFDSSGHPADPRARLAGLPPADDEVRPVTIGDNVWIGSHAMIFPGVTIGEGSVVSAGSIVTADVPPYTVVAGNPARRIAVLNRAEDDPDPARPEVRSGVREPAAGRC
jgi:acetyltransferase-like isoleucine patch superfamily enzyme